MIARFMCWVGWHSFIWRKGQRDRQVTGERWQCTDCRRFIDW